MRFSIRLLHTGGLDAHSPVWGPKRPHDCIYKLDWCFMHGMIAVDCFQLNAIKVCSGLTFINLCIYIAVMIKIYPIFANKRVTYI